MPFLTNSGQFNRSEKLTQEEEGITVLITVSNIVGKLDVLVRGQTLSSDREKQNNSTEMTAVDFISPAGLFFFISSILSKLDAFEAHAARATGALSEPLRSDIV